MPSITRARLQLLAAAVLFSTGGAAIKLCSLSSWQVASFRSAVAAVALLWLLPEARQRATRRVPLVGCVYAATLILFVVGSKLTTAASTIFLQSTAPLYIAVAAPWLLREPTQRRDLIFMVVLAIGLVLLLVGPDAASATAPNPGLGNLAGSLSGVTWAATLMGLRWMASDGVPGTDSSAAAVLWGNGIAFLACLPLAIPVAAARLTDWLIILFLGTCQIGVAYLFVTRAVGRVPALEASLLLLLEPVLNPLWTWMIHGERPGPWSVAGGVVILAATAAKACSAGGSAGSKSPRFART
jgi:DME family drug/metabolite transporter